MPDSAKAILIILYPRDECVSVILATFHASHVGHPKITALTNAKDHERLALLKEVAGTKVYEQRRAESLRIMAETDAKRSKIDELIEYIETRLTELEEEKEELREFQDKDKERRCLEYAMYQRDLEEVTGFLEELEAEHRSEIHTSNVRREQFSDRERQAKVSTLKRLALLDGLNVSRAQSLEQSISRLRTLQTTLNLTLQGTQAELTDMIRSRTELQCTVDDLQTAAERAGGQRATLEAELEQVEENIAAREQSLAELLPQWNDHRARENEEKKRLDEARIKLDSLFGKRGRLQKYRTRAERDRYLREEIASVQGFAASQQTALDNARQELHETQTSLAETQERTEAAVERAENGLNRAKTLGEQLAEMKDEHADLVEKRKELWREETKLKSLVDSEADELRAAERLLASMMDKV